MAGKEALFWIQVREFQKDLEQLKQDIERKYEIRRELDEIKRNQR